MFSALSCKSKKEEKKVLPPPLVSLSLKYIRGAEGDRSAATVTIMNRFMVGFLNNEDPTIESQFTREQLKKSTILKVKKDEWLKTLTFLVQEGEGNAELLTQGIRLVEAPSKELVIDQKTAYSITLEFDSRVSLRKNQVLHATLKVGDGLVESNRVQHQPSNEDPLIQLRRKGIVDRVLKDHPALLETSQEMIKNYPDKSTGYYYQGLAYELKGDLKKALTSFEKTKSILGTWDPTKHQEPPVVLLRKINELRAKLAQ